MVMLDYAAITAAAGLLWLLIAQHPEARAREAAESRSETTQMESSES